MKDLTAIQRILDKHAIEYSRATKKYIMGEYTEQERDAHFRETDRKSEQALEVLQLEKMEHAYKKGLNTGRNLEIQKALDHGKTVGAGMTGFRYYLESRLATLTKEEK